MTVECKSCSEKDCYLVGHYQQCSHSDITVILGNLSNRYHNSSDNITQKINPDFFTCSIIILTLNVYPANEFIHMAKSGTLETESSLSHVLCKPCLAEKCRTAKKIKCTRMNNAHAKPIVLRYLYCCLDCHRHGFFKFL